MPGGDRTGPQGGGPGTGRGLGGCVESDQLNNTAPQPAQRFRYGFGRGGRGRGRGRDGQGKGQGPGRMSGPLEAGPGGFCICPSCGHKVEHVAGKPCNRQKCPNCGTIMTRE